MDALLDTWESYTGFCYLHQFPPTLSDKIKTRLYFLASQTRWNWTRYLDKVLPSAGPLLDRVIQHPVTQPVRSQIHSCEPSLGLTCTAPAGSQRDSAGHRVPHDGRLATLPAHDGVQDVVLQELSRHARAAHDALAGHIRMSPYPNPKLTLIFFARFSSSTSQLISPRQYGRRRGSTSRASSRSRLSEMWKRLSRCTRLQRWMHSGSYPRRSQHIQIRPEISASFIVPSRRRESHDSLVLSLTQAHDRIARNTRQPRPISPMHDTARMISKEMKPIASTNGRHGPVEADTSGLIPSSRIPIARQAPHDRHGPQN